MSHVRLTPWWSACQRAVLLTALACLLAGVTAGCNKGPGQGGQNEAPAVPVARPVPRAVTDFADFTGRTDPVHAVDVRARVTGFLVSMPFREGSKVKEGDLLFEIDPRPYQAQLEQAESQVRLNDASLKLARTTLERDRASNAAAAGSVTQQQLDQDEAAVTEAEARLKASESSTKVFRLNLEFTKVTSPIDGQISRYYYTKGNLIIQDQTLLTTVVSLDPMFAYFDMDEATLLRIRRAINEGRVKLPEHRWWETAKFPVFMALQGEAGFPHRGTVDFLNNQVNPATGSISVRGLFENKPPREGGARLLSPGMFVRVRLPIGQPYPALLVIDRAVVSDQGIKYVYVLDAENKAQYRRVSTGPLQEDGLRVITEGLQPDDWVVVGGLQSVRPKMEVRPQQTAMPTLGPAGQSVPVSRGPNTGK
jgi:membrane fusion protein, multidrug efflux system